MIKNETRIRFGCGSFYFLILLFQQPHMHFRGTAVGKGVVGDQLQREGFVSILCYGVERLRSGGTVAGGDDGGQQEFPVGELKDALGVDGYLVKA